ncbi:MAG: helix-turn-helix domain-containing protein, partial [Lachnospiraceae bacterium]|nr:helix-turn-helix domain-containing protein [Lachnospiraceae bacterium]
MGRLKELRRRRGLTQEGLANVLGTSQQTISRIENNENMIPTDLLVKLAKFYSVSADYIVALTDEKYNQGGGRD